MTAHSILGKLCVYMLACLPALIGSACHADEQPAAWAASLFATTEHEFGTVAPGADAICQYELTNGLDEEVRILGVDASCGCTTATIQLGSGRDSLRPGESGHITAAMETLNKSGPQSVTMTVSLARVGRDGVQRLQRVQLKLAGRVTPNLSLTPFSIDFATVQNGDSINRSLLVSAPAEGEWRLGAAEAHVPWLRVRLKKRAHDSRNAAYRVVVTLADDTPLGYFREPIDLLPEAAGAAAERVFVQGRVVPYVTASPEVLHLAGGYGGSPVVKQIILSSREPFKITGVKGSMPGVSVEYPKTPSVKKVVRVVVESGLASGAKQHAIELRTDLERRPVVTVPVIVDPVPAASSSRMAQNASR